MTTFSEVAVEIAVERIADIVAERQPGHCLRVDTLPLSIASPVCARLHEILEEPNLARLVVTNPSEPWHVTPTGAVSLRNLTEHPDSTVGVLVIFITPDLRIATDDSIGASTFEVVQINNLNRAVLDRAMDQLREKSERHASVTASIVRHVLDSNRFDVTLRNAADFVISVAADESNGPVGSKLTEIGLLPDRHIDAAPEDERMRRLEVNSQEMRALTETRSPAERLRHLPIDSENPRGKKAIAAMKDVLADGTVQKDVLAKRLAERATEVDYSNWEFDIQQIFIDELRVVSLIGDFEQEDELTIRKAEANVGITFVCSPAPANVPGLERMALRVMRVGSDADDLSETGFEFTKKTLPRRANAQWKRKFTIDDGDSSLEQGLYRFQLEMRATDNSVVKHALSPVFRVGGVTIEAPTQTTPVLGVVDARVKSLALAGLDCIGKQLNIDVTANGGGVDLTIRIPDVPTSWRVSHPRVLADLEAELLDDPDITGFSITLGESTHDWLVPGPLPEPFLEARSSLFKAIAASQRVHTGEWKRPLVSLADLRECTSEIEHYLKVWTEELARGDAARRCALLSTDRIEISHPDGSVDVLIGPTHPLRIAWLSEMENTVDRWLTSVDQRTAEDLLETEIREVDLAMDQLVDANTPHIVPAPTGPARFIDALSREWGLWAASNGGDASSRIAAVRNWFGLGARRLGATSERELITRVRRYLRTHPYVHTLMLNFVQPGDADLALRLMADLQGDPTTRHLRYVIRLFGDPTDATLGSSLDNFMLDPEVARNIPREIADALTTSGGDALKPKISYSKHDVKHLAQEPESFAAHLTFFIDFFRPTIDPVPAPPAGRSSYGNGLILEPIQVYERGSAERPPRWISAVSAVGDEGPFGKALAASQSAMAKQLGGVGIEPTPALRLEISAAAKSLLDSVHRSSDWVVVIDAVFGDEFFDEPPATPGAHPQYVIDIQTGSHKPGGRNVVVSTRLREEQIALLATAAKANDFPIPAGGEDRLTSALHLLGAGLALRMLVDDKRSVEALSLALAGAYLSRQGILRHALVVPIDLHQDLFFEGVSLGITGGRSRTDLAVIQLDPSQRTMNLFLIEVKVRSNIQANSVPEKLVDEIRGQLDNTQDVLRHRLFGAGLDHQPNAVSSALQIERLTQLLTRYLRRSFRWGFLPESDLEPSLAFIDTLDRSYSLSIERHALIFSGVARGVTKTSNYGDIGITVLGPDAVTQLLAEEAPWEPTRLPEGKPEIIRSIIGSGGPTTEGVAAEDSADREGPVGTTSTSDAEPGDVKETARVDFPTGPSIEDVDVLGKIPDPKQFGIIGRNVQTRRPVAIDTDGTNVVSVFGLQGSGKSYTVGNIIEAALVPEPSLNRLGSPLGVVVFHYSTDQTYRPEFASMAAGNDVADKVDELESDWGARPAPASDVQLLVPQGVMDERAREFPDLSITPLLFAPSELQLSDWKLLMGIASGEQMYAKSMARVMQQLRSDITLEQLRAAIDASDLTKQQQSIAQARLRFVEAYVREGAGISNLVRPGRLLIVDLRDEFIDREEALALFMVLLNRFSQIQGDQGKQFSKLIVFDEAHKYMRETRLTEAITTTVREMRHKGTSVVIASQDPPSIPAELIELSSILIAHKFTSPAWLKHLQRVSQPFSSVQGGQMIRLEPGEAYVWAEGNDRYLRPQVVRMRPRVTLHGGSTRRASN
jgi:DNA phosphorothioation-dependent restriction protein DptH